MGIQIAEMSTSRIPPASDGEKDLRFLAEIVAILATERQSKGITFRELGAETGYNYGYYSRAERGLTEPGIISLCRWCRALGLDFVDVAQRARGDRRLDP